METLAVPSGKIGFLSQVQNNTCSRVCRVAGAKLKLSVNHPGKKLSPFLSQSYRACQSAKCNSLHHISSFRSIRPHLVKRPAKVLQLEKSRGQVCCASSEANQSRPIHTTAKAAFFDVDGTIAKTNIVWPYVYLRLRELSLLARVFWVPYFSALTILYRLADKIDRGLLCRFFYFNYRGRPAAAALEWGKFAYEHYMRPRVFRAAIQRIQELKAAGFRVVLVTGSLSFMVAPLAAEIEADDVIAADLVERDGRFTGQMASAAFNVDDKETIVKEYAAKHGIDLGKSHAYGDSIADLRMLESVGHPHAVLPDKRLRQIAELRGWSVVTDWAIEEKPPHPLSRLWV